jgi:hypothetical protein
MVRHELLVRGHDRLAGEQRAAGHPVIRRPQPANDSMMMSTSAAPMISSGDSVNAPGRHPIDALSRDAGYNVRELHAGHFAAAQNAGDRLPDGPERAAPRGYPSAELDATSALPSTFTVDSSQLTDGGFTLLFSACGATVG